MTEDTGAVALLESLVATPSPSRQEAAAVDVLVDWMRANQFDAHRDAVGNAVGSRGSGPREVLLLGHIDTFPGVVPLRRDGGKLYGRGTVDAKGPLAAFAAATARVTVPAGWKVTVVGAVEEECWTSRGARHVISAWPAAAPPAAVIVGEPSRWDRITMGYRGSVELRLRMRAPNAHSAGNTPMPAERAVELWRGIEEFCASRNAGRPATEFDRVGVALRSIRTRTAGRFGEARLVAGLRLPPGEGLVPFTGALRSALESRVEGWGANGAGLALQFRGGQEAHQAPKNTPLVSAFLAGIRAEGGEPRFVRKTGTADFNLAGGVWPSVPMVAYGPGDSALDHTPDEHIEIAEFERAITVLTRVLDRLMQHDG